MLSSGDAAERPDKIHTLHNRTKFTRCTTGQNSHVAQEGEFTHVSRLEKHNRKGLGVEGARKEYGEEAPEDQDRKEGNWLEMVDAPFRMYCRIVWCTRLRRSIRGPDNGGGGAGGGGGVDGGGGGMR